MSYRPPSHPPTDEDGAPIPCEVNRHDDADPPGPAVDTCWACSDYACAACLDPDTGKCWECIGWEDD